MDVQKSSVGWPAFQASCVAAGKTLAVIMGIPILMSAIVQDGPPRAIVGILLPPILILSAIRKINRRDDPRSAKPPPDPP